MIAPVATDFCAICRTTMPWASAQNVYVDPDVDLVACPGQCSVTLTRMNWLACKTVPRVTLTVFLGKLEILEKNYEGSNLHSIVSDMYTAAGGK